MKILAIETSCDDTCAAVVDGVKIMSNVVSSQTDLFAKWGGVVPDVAKRAHQKKIGLVTAEALKRGFELTKTERMEEIVVEGMKYVEVVAVTKGPGLAIALAVGINQAKQLALKYRKRLVAVNHVEGHLLSNWLTNKNGIPDRKIELPALALTVSGGHTKIVLIEKVGVYRLIGETVDDAAGEALDKAAKLLGLGYPGGPIIERLAKNGNKEIIKLPRPMVNQNNFNYSFSGLKTSLYYQTREWPKEKIGKHLADLAATFQEAVFDTLLTKFEKAIEEYKPKSLMGAGGVMANLEIRKMLRRVAKKRCLPIFMPFKKELNTDNAAMIGAAGYFKALRGEFEKNIELVERDPRWEI